MSLRAGLNPLTCDYGLEATDLRITARTTWLQSVLVRTNTGVWGICFTVATLLAWFSGAFQTEFGGYPDEAAHYVTALMIRDYIASGFSMSPLRFAENYYLHYPKVAFGHWPPVFHSMQGIWMLLFGESREAMLVLLSLLTSIVAFLLYRVVKQYFGAAYGLWAAALYLLLTPIQLQNTMVMTEPALSLFGMLALLSFARYLENERWQSALYFALWTTLAILTKGDGLAFLIVVPLTLLFARRLQPLLNVRFWAGAMVIAAVSIPFTFWSFKMAQQGWMGQLGWTYISNAIPAQTKLLAVTFGAVLSGLALIGIGRAFRRGVESPLLAAMAAYALGIVIFQALVPSGVEMRKLAMAFPAILFLTIAGARSVGQVLRTHARPAWAGAMALGIGTVAWAASSFTLVERPAHGYKDVAQFILANHSLRDAVILVSANEPSLGEGMLIAEVAEREARPGHFILRASKVISHSDWSGAQNYRMLYKTSDELMQALDKLPVNIVVADYPPTPESPPHHRLLLEAIRQNPERWTLLFSGTDPGAPGGNRRIGVFQANTAAIRRSPVLKLDLTETLGRTLSTPGS